MYKFEFSKSDYEYLIDKCMIKDSKYKLDKILEFKILGYSNVEIATELNMSIRTLSRNIKKLVNKLSRHIC